MVLYIFLSFYQAELSLEDSYSLLLSTFRDHRKLFVGDFRGRIYSWSVTDAAGGILCLL